MRLLTFDTSTNALYLCLMDAGNVVLEKAIIASESNRQEAVSRLVPSIREAMLEVNWHQKDLDAIVVGTGPGSFTGIRAGVVTARTLAQALSLPLLGVSTFECMARGATEAVAVILSGAQGHFFVAAYAPGKSEPLVSPAYISHEELNNVIGEIKCWLADEAATVALDVYGPRLRPLPIYKNIAVVKSQIAWDRLSFNESQIALAEEYSWKYVEPLYLRGPSVTIKKNHGN